jgi:glycosyltransferase involved in cell wall biosynthesis
LSLQRDSAKISVIIPTLEEEEVLGSLLEDLRRQSKPPAQVFVVDAYSSDATPDIAQRFGATLLRAAPPLANQRNAGGRRASGDLLVFLDADVRLPRDFLENFETEFYRRELDLACSLYVPHDSTYPVHLFHAALNRLLMLFERLLPSGGGSCIAVRRRVFMESSGFDPELKFDDIELIRRLARSNRFGVVREPIFVSDRRFRRFGTPKTVLQYALLSLLFALGRFRWANRLDYRAGDSTH